MQIMETRKARYKPLDNDLKPCIIQIIETTNQKEIKMYITKAEQVAQAYDAALRDNLYSKDCYALAIDAAVALGGIEIDRSTITESCTSKVTFEFDDASIAQVKYGGVRCYSAAIPTRDLEFDAASIVHNLYGGVWCLNE